MRLAIAKDVGVVERGDIVYVAALPDGPILVLSDAAAAAWRAVGMSHAVGMPDAELEGSEHIRALMAAGLLIDEGEN